MSIASPDKSMGARLDVLAFYRQLPFNYRTDAAAHATAIRDADPLLAYPPLVDQLVEKPSMIDIGCGAGWVVNSAAYHHGCPALGIDFNPVAVERARRVADALDVDVSFEVADLFKYVPEQKLELAISIGVLHHTDDCLGAIRHIAEQIVSPGGRLFIGLYHSHGRRPFLKHFEAAESGGQE